MRYRKWKYTAPLCLWVIKKIIACDAQVKAAIRVIYNNNLDRPNYSGVDTGMCEYMYVHVCKKYSTTSSCPNFYNYQSCQPLLSIYATTNQEFDIFSHLRFPNFISNNGSREVIQDHQ